MFLSDLRGSRISKCSFSIWWSEARNASLGLASEQDQANQAIKIRAFEFRCKSSRSRPVSSFPEELNKIICSCSMWRQLASEEPYSALTGQSVDLPTFVKPSIQPRIHF
jgi:hypothetical protein